MSDIILKDDVLDVAGKGISSSSKGEIKVYEIDIEVTSVPYKDLTNKIPGLDQLSHSTIILIGISIILALLFLCCLTLCLMRKWKKKYYNCLHKGDERCDPKCCGSRRPLLRGDKSADSMSRTSHSSTRD